MVFKSNIPQPNDLLSDSQADLLENMTQLDAVYGTDHYAYSDTSLNANKHKKVTTPDQVTAPVTTTDPVLYGLDLTGSNVGVIQYSRGPNNAVPTPLTTINSPSVGAPVGALSTITIFDTTGITLGFGTIHVTNPSGQSAYATFWTNGALTSVNSMTNTNQNIIITNSGVNLQAKNNNNFVTTFYYVINFDWLE